MMVDPTASRQQGSNQCKARSAIEYLAMVVLHRSLDACYMWIGWVIKGRKAHHNADECLAVDQGRWKETVQSCGRHSAVATRP
jgi:hypothetical protein